MDDQALLATEQEDEHEALLEFLYVCPHGLIEFDSEGVVRMVNPACARMLMPLLRSEQQGGMTNILESLHPFAPDLGHRLKAFREPRGMVLEGLHIHVGRLHPGAPPVILALTVLRLARDRNMAVLVDVSDQVAQQRRLGEVENWLSALADGADGYAFFGLDATGRVDTWNDGAQRLFGLSAQAAIGLEGDRLLTATGEATVLANRLSRVREEGWQVLEGWMAGPKGGRFWGTSIVSAMGTEAVEPATSSFLAVVRDMTDRREAVQALREALCQDHLTGLLNRRRFFELGEAECRRMRRGRQALSVIMVDADHFKTVNDHYGHSAGDAVLRALATLLRRLTREEIDLVGRLGGEEFALLLPGRGAAAAVAVAERLRQAVAAEEIGVLDRAGGALTLRLTASFGVAEQDALGDGLESLLAAADAALYAAKAAGRDCVRLTQPMSS